MYIWCVWVSQMATLNPFENTKIVDEAFLSPVVKEIDIHTSPELIELPIINEVAPSITQHKYYIIAGAFAVQKNADKMLAKLNSWNYNAELSVIIESDTVK